MDKGRDLIDIPQTVSGDRGLASQVVTRGSGRHGSQLLVRAAIGRVNAEGLERPATQVLAVLALRQAASERVPGCTEAVRRHANSTESTPIRPGSHRLRLLDIARVSSPHRDGRRVVRLAHLHRALPNPPPPAQDRAF